MNASPYTTSKLFASSPNDCEAPPVLTENSIGGFAERDILLGAVMCSAGKCAVNSLAEPAKNAKTARCLAG